jgi:hypothetical protein
MTWENPSDQLYYLPRPAHRRGEGRVNLRHDLSGLSCREGRSGQSVSETAEIKGLSSRKRVMHELSHAKSGGEHASRVDYIYRSHDSAVCPESHIQIELSAGESPRVCTIGANGSNLGTTVRFGTETDKR